MANVFTLLQMEINTKVNIRMIKKMEKVFTLIEMVANTKVIL